MPYIVINNVRFAYPRAELVFNKLNLKVGASSVEGTGTRGNIVTVMGSSGCGKSTLLRLIAGVEQPQSGAIYTEPDALTISYLPQEPILFEHLSREKNARYLERIGAMQRYFSESLFKTTTQKLRMETVLRVKSNITAMSGGERQRLCLLRALSISPQVLLLDEPCTGLDPPVKQEFLAMLREVTDAHNLLVIYVTHHADEARLIADEVVYISTGANAHDLHISHMALSEFIEDPPNLDAAQFFSTPALNVINCYLDGRDIKTSQRGTIISRCISTPPNPGEYVLAFAPESTCWSAVSGQRVMDATHSDRYCFGNLATEAGPQRVIGPSCNTVPNYFSVQGKAFLCKGMNGQLARVTVVCPSASESVVSH